jgi:hypothetical protein
MVNKKGDPKGPPRCCFRRPTAAKPGASIVSGDHGLDLRARVGDEGACGRRRADQAVDQAANHERFPIKVFLRLLQYSESAHNLAAHPSTAASSRVTRGVAIISLKILSLRSSNRIRLSACSSVPNSSRTWHQVVHASDRCTLVILVSCGLKPRRRAISSLDLRHRLQPDSTDDTRVWLALCS